jgi:hypothetical protein
MGRRLAATVPFVVADLAVSPNAAPPAARHDVAFD